MYAELVVQTERNLPGDIGAVLREQWGEGARASQVIPLMALADWDDWVHLVRFAQVTSSTAYLVFTPDPRTLTLHVESRVPQSGFRMLRGIVEDETRRVRTLLARHDNAAESFTVRLYAEHTHMQTGRMLTRVQRVLEEFRATVLSTLYVPVSAFLLSLLLRYDVTQSLYNVGAAVTALVVWGAGVALFTRPGYQYKEEG
jgi:hypothetical protein